jgi:hypothetical protein
LSSSFTLAHARLVLDFHVPLLDRPEDALKGLDRRLALPHLDVRDASEKLRLDVVLATSIDFVEKAEGLRELAVSVLVPTEQVVQLPEELFLLLIVELADVSLVILAHPLDDVSGLGQVGRQLREPEEGLVILQVIRPIGDLAEDRICALVELELV